ncbi:MAG TPA: carbon-nitrogen hydrolase family protein [Thermoanaerobaculia bacterium]|nr:carbon-nitrogen hydrolase family protein [Thermoanaerobaculia bacterium]
MSFLVAAVQLQSTSNEASNLDTAAALIERAAGYGARLAATPENTNFLGPHEQKVRGAQPLDGPVCSRFAELARRHSMYVLLGSFNEENSQARAQAAAGAEGPAKLGRCNNTSVLFGPDGARVAVYRKIHLFDVDVSEEVRFKESATIAPGSEVVTAPTELGTLGLSVCYDLRFAELYAALVKKGAQIITVPSAFTLMTGKDHWYPLLRARAIETQCYVIAPAQSGKHDDRGLRQSYGNSIVIDPWGQVIGSASDGPGLALAEVDLERVAKVRGQIPVAEHRRL